MERLVYVGLSLLLLVGEYGIFGAKVNTRRCERAGKHRAKGIIFDRKVSHGITKRIYKCHDQQMVLNVPDKTTFFCEYYDDIGKWQWRHVNDYKFLSSNLTCQAKVSCAGSPPEPVDNMIQTSSSIYRYQKTPVNTFFEGDTFRYRCKEGYKLCGPSNDTDYYSYYDDDSSCPDAASDTIEIGCANSSNNGIWRDTTLGEVELGECEAISCNASKFDSVEHGRVYKLQNRTELNHTEVYNYGEVIRLQCDEGYIPQHYIDYAICLDPSSFTYLSLKCRRIVCPIPPKIANGERHYEHRTPNSTVTYKCDIGFELSGQSRWTCQDDGQWDGYCARCDSEDTYCLSPCVPLNGILLNPQPFYSIGSVVSFQCKDDVSFGGSENRTCLYNRQWSGSDLDCTGKQSILRGTSNLKSALFNIVQKNNQTLEGVDNDDGLVEKAFKENLQGGTDVYIADDVSGSINEEVFEKMKQFITAMIRKLSINGSPTGTRLAVLMFATKVKSIGDDHHSDGQRGHSEEEWIQEIDNMDLEDIRKDTGSGTAFDVMLQWIQSEQLSKDKGWSDGTLRQAQQVLIIISDGKNNMGIEPSKVADELKSTYKVDIYSICMVSEKDRDGINDMKAIASGTGDKSGHFFRLPNRAERHDFDDILKLMIEGGETCVEAGCTFPDLTDFKKENNRSIANVPAKRNAWPWMVQLNIRQNAHQCGGSIINDRWILTAAHCFNKTSDIYSVAFGKILRIDDKHALELKETCYFPHPKYDTNSNPKYLYDIALVRVEKAIQFDNNIHAVYLPNSTDIEKFQKSKQYGVVTGWGKTDTNGDLANELKQMQMEVQTNKTCSQYVEEKRGKANVANYYDNGLMFCAGGEENVGGKQKFVDTCQGDSGGPFVVPFPDDIPDKRDFFAQRGIVSHGIGDCKKADKYGFYTKLDKELLEWIETTITTKKDTQCN